MRSRAEDSTEGPNGGRSSPPGIAALLPLSAAVLAGSFADGLVGASWLTELLIVLAVAQGTVAGLAFPTFWVSSSDVMGQLTGPGGKFLLFLFCVAFSAVESHAVGVGLAAGAPPMVLSLLVPPMIVGAAALRGALSGSRES